MRKNKLLEYVMLVCRNAWVLPFLSVVGRRVFIVLCDKVLEGFMCTSVWKYIKFTVVIGTPTCFFFNQFNVTCRNAAIPRGLMRWSLAMALKYILVYSRKKKCLPCMFTLWHLQLLDVTIPLTGSWGRGMGKSREVGDYVTRKCISDVYNTRGTCTILQGG